MTFAGHALEGANAFPPRFSGERLRAAPGVRETFEATGLTFGKPARKTKLDGKPGDDQDDEDEGKLRGFRATAYSGAPIARWYGKLVLDLKGGKLGTLHGKLPMLLNHWDDRVTGYADEIAIGEGPVELSGYLSRATEHGVRVAQLADEGFPWTMSVGVMMNSVEEVQEGAEAECNGAKFAGPCSIARQWDLIETSFVTCNPADRNTDAEIMRASAEEQSNMADPKGTATNIEELTRARDEATKATVERLGALRKAFPDRPDFAMEQFLQGKSVLEAQAAESVLLREELAKLKANPPRVDVSDLRRQAGTPAIGFSGPERETASAGPLTREQLSALPASEAASAVWDRDLTTRQEMLLAARAISSHTGTPVSGEELLGAYERSAHKAKGITPKMEQDVALSLGFPVR